MDLVMHFESCGSLRAPVPGLLIYLSIWIEQTLWGGYTVSCVLNRLALNYTKPIR